MPTDMTDVIEDSLTDANLSDAEPVDVETPTEAPDATPDVVDTPEDTSPTPPAARASEEPVVATEDYAAFAKEHGLPPQIPGQRENRVPISRAKVMVEKARAKAVEPFKKEIETYKTRAAETDGYLQNVQKFEDIMKNNHMQFLQMLVKIPGYQEIFQQLAGSQSPKATESTAPAEPVGDGMPEPDTQLTDGTAVYSMDGLRKRDEWHAQQVQKRVMEQVQKDYQPLKEAWEVGNYRAAKVREVQQQLTDARQWPQFTEHETEIEAALRQHPQMSLEGAYRFVVFPHLRADRETMRKELMAEMKAAPRSTAAPTTATKSVPGGNGKRSIVQIITDSIDRKYGK